MSAITQIHIGDNCLICYEDLDDEIKVMYQDNPSSNWKQGGYCIDCTEMLKNNLWNKYKNDVEKADCKRSLRNALQAGPPINIRDVAFPCENKTGEVYKLKCGEDEINPKLEGSLVGEEREKWWVQYKAILDAMDDVSIENKETVDETLDTIIKNKDDSLKIIDVDTIISDKIIDVDTIISSIIVKE
jgi:hypothetical protein